eukprot:6175230-Pleurochrysis_carterae.AAC.3
MRACAYRPAPPKRACARTCASRAASACTSTSVCERVRSCASVRSCARRFTPWSAEDEGPPPLEQREEGARLRLARKTLAPAKGRARRRHRQLRTRQRER